MDRLGKINQLLRIKKLRSKLAEMEVAKVRRTMNAAQNELSNSQMAEQHLRDTKEQRRNDRLEELLSSEGNASVRNVRLANVYAVTNQEISNAAQTTQTRMTELAACEERVKLERAKLARFLQVEERTNKLCERLEKMKQLEAARKV